jgi:hypothetical protein
MHNLYEGYFSYLLNLWYNQRDINLVEIDRQWMKQTLPFFTHKTPRSIVQNINHLKAFEVFIIFHYFHPLFKDYMPKENYDHVKQLIQIVEELSQPIYRSRTFSLDKQLLLNLIQHKNLYGVNSCTLNSHLLTHLSYCVRVHGPLPLLSAFLFEGTIKSFVAQFYNVNSIPHSLKMFEAKQIITQSLQERNIASIWVNHYEYLINNENSLIYDTYKNRVGRIIKDSGNTVTIRFSNNTEEMSKKNQNLLPCIRLFLHNHFYYYPILSFTYFYI